MFERLKEVEHYSRYPCMKPWIGEHYNSRAHKRLLTIGESHYLPKGATIHLDPDAWYSGSQSSLTDDERKWISTFGIIECNIDKNFPRKSFSIYRNLGKAINACSLQYSRPSQIFNHFAYYNFFQRPAENTGGSIKVKPLDREVSISVFESLLELLQPELIIFTSRLAGNVGKVIADRAGIPVLITPHPGCAWWGRYSKKYGGRARDLVPKFLNENAWGDFHDVNIKSDYAPLDNA